MDAAASQDMEISGLSAHGNPLHPDKNYSDEHAKDLKNAVTLAEKIGVKVVNCFGGCPGAGEDAKYPSWITCPWPSYFEEGIRGQWEEKAIPFWKEIVQVLRDNGSVFALEMAPGDLVYNPETLLMLREGVGDEIC